MSNLAHVHSSYDPIQSLPNDTTARALFFALNKDDVASFDLDTARGFLLTQLEKAKKLTTDLPSDLNDISAWIQERTDLVGRAYQQYLTDRKSGAPRKYFTSKSHALYFVKGVAPTKLVDGSWLYGLLPRWRDPDFRDLIRTYLEELGDGVPEKNHVVLYKKLLATHGCEQWEDLSDDHFVQGAIQLALAYDAERFLPEIIGFNLGYEQLPLHLLITAYELNELGIDPYYFTLHVTVDNAATGHAQKAQQALRLLMPRIGDADAFYRRVMDGYRLNDLGANTESVIASFGLDAELVRILGAKSSVGKHMHSDYCRIAGRTINDWLADPLKIPQLLNKMVETGWIKRGEDPENSRFWRLIQSERAEMFGVFNDYEQQVLRDWISVFPGRSITEENDRSNVRTLTYRAKQRSLDALGQQVEKPYPIQPARNVIRHRFANKADGASEGRSELRVLEDQLASMASKTEAMTTLTALMSPSCHHTAGGLMATRIFNQLLG